MRARPSTGDSRELRLNRRSRSIGKTMTFFRHRLSRHIPRSYREHFIIITVAAVPYSAHRVTFVRRYVQLDTRARCSSVRLSSPSSRSSNVLRNAQHKRVERAAPRNRRALLLPGLIKNIVCDVFSPTPRPDNPCPIPGAPTFSDASVRSFWSG